MRITFVIPFADLSGGVRVTTIYAEGLMRRGHQVQVVSVPLRRPNLRQSLMSVMRGKGWPQVAKEISHLDNSAVPHKVLNKSRPITDADVPDADVVIGTWWETQEWVAAMSPRKGAKVSFIQGYDAVFYETFPAEKQAQVLGTWKLPAHKVIVSRWLVDLARERFGDTFVSLVPNGVDLKQFGAEPRGRQAASTVGLQYAYPRCKGTDVALAAIALATKEIPGLQVAAFGRDEPSSAHPLPAGAKYSILPKQEKIREVYSACDAWISASRCEGFGLPLLEAMACRTPVIATPTGAAPELIEGGGGILVPNEDPEAMCRAIVQLFQMSEGAWKTMSDAAHATAQRYTWEDATVLFEAALQVAIERQGRGELTRPPLAAGIPA